MFDIHIEEFFLDSARILKQIYQSFPRPVSVFVEDISGDDQPDEYGLHSDRHQATFGTMLWLEKENYLRFEDTIRQEAIDQATLTARGLALLATACHDDFLLTLVATVSGQARSLQAKPNIVVIDFLIKNGTSSQLAIAMQHLFEPKIRS